MMERDREREGLRVCRAAWLIGVNVREYRELEAGEQWPDAQTWRSNPTTITPMRVVSWAALAIAAGAVVVSIDAAFVYRDLLAVWLLVGAFVVTAFAPRTLSAGRD